MKGIFSPDSKLFAVMNRLADLIMLNIIYLITCIPVITVGAATTALYAVSFQMNSKDERSAVKSYFTALKQNWKQSTAFFIPLFLFLCISIFDMFIISQSASFWSFTKWIVAPMAVLTALVLTMIFPLISQFEAPWKITFKNAILLSLGRLPAAVLLAVFQFLPFALFIINPLYLLKSGYFWILIYFSGLFFLGAKLLRKVFQPVYDKSTQAEP